MYLIAIVVIVRTISDLLFKQAVNDCDFDSFQSVPKTTLKVLKKPVFSLAVLFGFINAMIWPYCLKMYDLSYAYPFLSICFITTMIGSKWFFGEHIGRYKIVGLGFVFVGCMLLVFG